MQIILFAICNFVYHQSNVVNAASVITDTIAMM